MPGGKEGSYKHRSVDASRFAMVPRSDVPRSAFDVSHTHKTTFNAGFLVPVYVEEVLPGDSIKLRVTAFARLSTPIVPVMDNIIMEWFFFFVPNRLVWLNWQRFMGEKLTPAETTSFLVPQVSVVATDPGSMADYFGITMNGTAESEILVNALPFRAYNLIYNEWFIDQDLDTPVTVETDDGPDTDTLYTVQFRRKRHDYFTSARPWPQKPINTLQLTSGDPFTPGGNMLLPQAGAPVTGFGTNVTDTAPQGAGLGVMNTGGRVLTFPFYEQDVFTRVTSTNIPDVRVLVNDIRTANMVQLIMEKNARAGTRYTELVFEHFRVRSPDARLQRPEYLGGGRANVTVNPVAQTSASGATGTTTSLGELAGVGSVVGTGIGFSQSFTEHGYIIGLCTVRADMSYQNGTNRMWFRRTQFDFYWPGLAHLGEQAILSREIYSLGDFDTAGDESVFGYQERYSEYKYKPNRISGWFRSTTATPLDMWHVAQNFATRPVLNTTFIREDPPIDRVLQVATNHGEQFLMDSMFDIRMVRAMPMFSIPGLGPRL